MLAGTWTHKTTLKPPLYSSVAEWKKKMMQWEKSREVVKETEPVVASQSEEEVPAWIKKLLGLFIQFYGN